MNIKIAVVYHNEPKICNEVKQHPDIYVPIVAGGRWNHKDYDIPNLLYDDVGDNISWLNPYINEITAIYWIERNIKQLGYPDFIGVQHYRRLFNLEEILPHVQDRTLILNQETVMLPTVDFLELCHGTGRYLVQISKDVLKLDHPGYEGVWEKAFNHFAFSRTYYSRNLFVVPREVLNGLVDYISKLLKYVVKDINFDMLGTPAARNIGFILERLVGFYFMVKQMTGYKVYPTMFHYVSEEELR